MQGERKHYRLGCLWDIFYQEPFDSQEEEENWSQGITTDISGGGCRFNSKERQKTGDMITVIIHMAKEKFVFKARVLASMPLQNSGGGYENRVEFLELSFLEQERLIKQIFEEKRKIQLQERGLSHEKKYFDY